MRKMKRPFTKKLNILVAVLGADGGGGEGLLTNDYLAASKIAGITLKCHICC